MMPVQNNFTATLGHRSERKKPKKGKKGAVLLASLCMLGLIYQSYYITSEYLSYNLVTEVTIDYPDKIFPPDVTICALDSLITNEGKKNRDREECKKNPNLALCTLVGKESLS